MEQFHPEKATDMELALFLIKHITNPCEDASGNNLRNFYLKEARRTVETIQNSGAKQLLEEVIKQYAQ